MVNSKLYRPQRLVARCPQAAGSSYYYNRPLQKHPLPLPLPLFLSLCFPLQFIHPHTGKSNSQPPLCWPSKSALALPSSDLTPNHLPNTEHYSPATLLNYLAPFCTFSTHSLRSCSVPAAAAGSVSETESDDPRDSRARKIDKDSGKQMA